MKKLLLCICTLILLSQTNLVPTHAIPLPTIDNHPTATPSSIGFENQSDETYLQDSPRRFNVPQLLAPLDFPDSDNPPSSPLLYHLPIERDSALNQEQLPSVPQLLQPFPTPNKNHPFSFPDSTYRSSNQPENDMESELRSRCPHLLSSRFETGNGSESGPLTTNPQSIENEKCMICMTRKVLEVCQYECQRSESFPNGHLYCYQCIRNWRSKKKHTCSQCKSPDLRYCNEGEFVLY